MIFKKLPFISLCSVKSQKTLASVKMIDPEKKEKDPFCAMIKLQGEGSPCKIRDSVPSTWKLSPECLQARRSSAAKIPPRCLKLRI